MERLQKIDSQVGLSSDRQSLRDKLLIHEYMPLPKLFQAWWAMRDPQTFFVARARGRDFFTVELPGFSTIHVVSTAEGARELMTAPAEVFQTLKGSPIDAVLGPNSMMVQEGEKHQRQRRLIMPCLGPGPMATLKQSFLKVVEEALAEMPQEYDLELAGLMQDLTLNIVIEVIFGVRDPQQKRRFSNAIKSFVSAATPSLLLIPHLRHRAWPPWRRFLKAQSQLDHCLMEQVNSLRSKDLSKPTSVLETMLTARDANGVGLSDNELRDELRTLLVAGHETTAVGMTWAFYYSLTNPHVLQRLRTELQECHSVLDDPLPYADAVCQEALRIHAIPPFAIRTLGQAYTIRGHQLKPGDHVALSMILLHRDPKVFTDPHFFRPERFLEKKYEPFQFLPFGSGVRRCIGAYFAQTEMRILTAALLQSADFEVLLKSKPRVVLRHINAGPDRPIPIRIRKFSKT